jgi:hypothetical protein
VAPYLRARRWAKSRACRRRSTVLAWESSAWYLGIGGGRGGRLPTILDVVGAPRPAKRVGLALVPVADESLDLVLLVVLRAEVTVANDPPGRCPAPGGVASPPPATWPRVAGLGRATGSPSGAPRRSRCRPAGAGRGPGSAWPTVRGHQRGSPDRRAPLRSSRGHAATGGGSRLRDGRVRLLASRC